MYPKATEALANVQYLEILMRLNEPVTQREYALDKDVTLMSTTDLQSHITYVNEAFVQASGFALDELLAQPHNLVRHPDMPKEAFADMWMTLKAGQSWSGLVKNRRKDGDHYWVRANATPIWRNGQLKGYMSVRTTPTREEIEGAEVLYRKMRNGEARHLRLFRGIVLRTGISSFLTWPKVMPISLRLFLPVLGNIALGWLWLAMGNEQTSALLGLIVIQTLCLMGAWVWYRQQIGRPLADVVAQAQRLASGQVNPSPSLDRVDEIGMLQRALNQSGLNMKALLDDVSIRVREVSDASARIATGNDDLSSRTEQTAANLQEAAASMEQLSSSIRQNAEAVGRAVQKADLASQAATHGGGAVRQVVTTMDSISQSSKTMTEIISVINGIAFQTNILALNAAVEAARAGEQGRGFAVVAAEVRSLAQKSAAAAGEIKVLIEKALDGVNAGVQMVTAAGQTMASTQSQVADASVLVTEIGAVTTEQASNVSQVSASVSQLEHITQKNAALVDQLALASRNLRHETTRLSEAVTVFI